MPRSRVPWAAWQPMGRGGSRTTGHARKITLHTMECGSPSQDCWPGYRGGGSTPHLSLNPGTGHARQHILLDRSAYALASPGSPRSPNINAGINIQIEIVGRAADTPRYDDAWYAQLGQWVGWLCDEWGVPKQFPFDFGASGTAGQHGRNRVSWERFRDASGIVGHQNVPFNDHWDPGALDQARLAAHLGGAHQPKEWDEMASKEEIRAVVREELNALLEHPIPVEYSDQPKPVRFVLASTQNRVRALTAKEFGSPDIGWDGDTPKPA